jgi:hypothetical protein
MQIETLKETQGANMSQVHLQNLQKRLATLVNTGNKDIINDFFKERESTNDLPDHLKTKLEKIGTTPLDEPEIAKLFEEGADSLDFMFHFFNEQILTEATEKDTAMMSLFSNKAVKKVMSHRDEKGFLKETPIIKNMRYPNPIDIQKVKNKQKKATKIIDELKTKYYILEEMSDEVREEMLQKESEFEAENKQVNEYILSFANLPKETTQWEKDIAIKILNSYIIGVISGTPLGKQY